MTKSESDKAELTGLLLHINDLMHTMNVLDTRDVFQRPQFTSLIEDIAYYGRVDFNSD